MKIYVYAISKNEELFAERWAKSMSEADGIFVLDTGSTDDTVHILRENGVTVESKTIEPWRFDDARNASLGLVPDDADLCVCTDLDEYFLSGWREKLELAATNAHANLVSYPYVWEILPDGKEGTSFLIRKTHARHGFTWRGIVHETVVAQAGVPVTETVAQNVKLIHTPDRTKSRALYLPLLERAVKEEPSNDRNAHYLGREYMFHGMFNQAIDALKKHLALPSARWEEERCASMRYISRCYVALGDRKNAFRWLLRAVGEYPFSREPFVELAQFLYAAEDYEGVVWAVKKALEIEKPSPSYVNEPVCFSSLPFDILSIAFYKTGNYPSALEAASHALSLSPNDERIAGNVKFFKSLLNHV